MTEDRQIVISMSRANTRLIFPKRDVKHLVHTIFNVPMTANGGGKVLNIPRKTE